jgi:ABC-2 type transport system ATP-binding protein
MVFYGTVAEVISSGPFKNLEDAYLWYAEEENEYENI